MDYLANIQRHLFEEIPDKTALIYEGQSISYAELGANVAKVRRALDLAQVHQNQVVAICLRKSPEHIYSIFGLCLVGYYLVACRYGLSTIQTAIHHIQQSCRLSDFDCTN